MSTQKTGQVSRSQEFLKRIELQVDEGERLLQDSQLRMRVELSLEPDFKVKNEQASAREFMAGLTLILLSCLTDQMLLSTLEHIATLLPPLKQIKDIVSTDEFNEVVAVHSQDRIEDRRQPLNKFKEELHAYLVRDKSKERKPEDQRTHSRRIQGFAPLEDNAGNASK